MDITTINTPEQLHQAIIKFLESDYSHEDLVKTYNDARKCIIRFRGDYSALPILPSFKDNALDGLQDVMDWCIKSSEVVDDIVFNLERQTISKVIRQLKKLREFPSRLLCWVNSKSLEQAQNEARAIRAIPRPSGTPLMEKAQKEVRGELDKLRLTEIVEKCERDEQIKRETVRIYLSKDPTLKNKLSQLNNEINKVFETLNKLSGSETPTGKLFDIYCKLKDIPLQRQFDDVGYAYSPIDLGDVIFGNCNRLYTSIDNVIMTFEEIQTKAEEKTDKSQPQEKPAETGRDAKRMIAAIIISLFVACIFELSVWFAPVTPFSWLKNHPNSYGLQGAIVFLVPCIFVGLLKRQYRTWCLATAIIPLVLLILSLLGGRTPS